jgi:hypothetical protein
MATMTINNRILTEFSANIHDVQVSIRDDLRDRGRGAMKGLSSKIGVRGVCVDPLGIRKSGM